jgi:hypothetical protein
MSAVSAFIASSAEARPKQVEAVAQNLRTLKV